MPTNANAYNSRVTDEALEKRFRDTFRSQGGAELVDDLYAQGVIVPVVDFTAAATGQQLAENLQTAWDFTTGHSELVNSTSTIVSTSGFWKIDLNATVFTGVSVSAAFVTMTDGLSSKTIWQSKVVGGTSSVATSESDVFVVFLRAGDSLSAGTNSSNAYLNISYRQIATVNGDLVNPSGFTSS